MSNDMTDIKKRARLMLRLEQPNAAINFLRIPESRHDAELCTLLAEAYFQRGDTKGDVHSSCFFASRAIELGTSTAQMQAIRAIGEFRKGQYADACDAFATFVGSHSSANTRYIFGLSCLRAGRFTEAERWLSSALETSHLHPEYTAALEETRRAIAGHVSPAAPVKAQPDFVLGGIHDQHPVGTPSPYRHHALSRLAGEARTVKDMHWLAVNIPCQEACPARTDIPRYLTEIYDGDYAAAYRTNLLDNIFPAVLGRVCARPCEKECRHGWEGLGKPVAICFSKRSAADFNPAADPVVLEPLFAPTGKTVAVVGSGVAGLSAARELARFGHTVTVYEKHRMPGGMMNQGIPVFRLPREHIDREIEQIRRMGVTIHCNTPIGKGAISLEQLTETFDAVVLAAGTLRPNMLTIPGADLKGIRHGLDFLLEVNDTGDATAGRNVVVVGGGFTAMDCARSARRLGVKLNADAGTDWRALPLEKSAANVNVYYRRSVNEMLVTPGEIEELEHEGIGMFTLVSPIAFLGAEGRVCSIRFIRNRLGEPDGSGRRRPETIAGSEFEVAADLVLLATGQFPDTAWMDGSLKASLVAPDQWLISGNAHRTAHAQIFAAGDFASGASSLIDAIGHAKACARVVDEALTGVRRLEDIARIEDATATRRIREMDFVPVQNIPVLHSAARTPEGEVETGYDEGLAKDETQRCYRCHFKYEIDSDKCIYCDWCIKAKPRPDCIVRVSDLIYGDNGEILGFERAKGSEDTKLIYINQADCIRCNACVDACPVDCISIQKVSRVTCPMPVR